MYKTHWFINCYNIIEIYTNIDITTTEKHIIIIVYEN